MNMSSQLEHAIFSRGRNPNGIDPMVSITPLESYKVHQIRPIFFISFVSVTVIRGRRLALTGTFQSPR